MKTIEARAIISADDKTNGVFDKIAAKIDKIGKSTKAAENIRKLTDSVTDAEKKLKALDRYSGARAGFDVAKDRLRTAQIEANRVATAMKAISAPNAKAAASEMQRVQNAVSMATKAYEAQKDAVLGHRRAISGMGLDVKSITSHQQRLRSHIDQTTKAILHQNNTMAGAAAGAVARRGIGAAGAGIMAAGGGLLTGYVAKEIGKKAVVSAAEMDIGVRKQRAFTDISAEDQKNILIPQAKRIGQDTQFSNLDVVKAQTATMQGLPSNITKTAKAQIAAGILENVKNYALIMEADLETSAQDIRQYLQSTGKNITTKEGALAESQKAVNQLVKMAKLGGMNSEDVRNYINYAGSSGTTAGLDSETIMSLGALARRGGLRGDQAGTFIRTASSKLVAPTKPGLTALNSAGIKYSDYVKMPSSLDPDRLEGQFKQDLGMGFSPAVKARLKGILSDPKVLADRGTFTQAVTGAVEPMFGKKKDGTMKAADRAKIAKSAGGFYKTSAESVNSQGLLDRIMESDMTLAQLNAFFTDKHGGKAAITQRQRQEYIAGRQALRESGNDPDYAKRKGDEIMGGLGGAFERLKGSVENLINAIGTANADRLKAAFDKIGNALDAVSNMSDPAMRFTTEIAAATAAVLTFRGAMAAYGLLAGAPAVAGAGGALAGGAALRGAAAGAAGLGLGALGWGGAAVGAYYYGLRNAPAMGGNTPGSRTRAGYIGGRPIPESEDLLTKPGFTRAGRSTSVWDGARGSTSAYLRGYPNETLGGGQGGAPVSVTGEATLNNKLDVNVKLNTEMFRAEVVGMVDSAVSKIQLRGGGFGGNGPGSTGRSSPDAAAPSTGFSSGGHH